MQTFQNTWRLSLAVDSVVKANAIVSLEGNYFSKKKKKKFGMFYMKGCFGCKRLGLKTPLTKSQTY